MSVITLFLVSTWLPENNIVCRFLYDFHVNTSVISNHYEVEVVVVEETIAAVNHV